MSAESKQSPVCVVVGVGPGNGATFVRRFAEEGYRVAMIARSDTVMSELASELGTARAYQCDVSDGAQIAATLKRVEADLGRVDVLVWNVGKGVWGNAEDVSLDAFEVAWRSNTFGAYAAAKVVIPAMKSRGSGAIFFIGATASRRGGAKTVAFAAAKAAQRSLAESLARHLWPHGIHVALVVVDGVVDEPLMRAQFADKADDFFVKPEDIADTLMRLTWQRRSAWSFELEARPFGEPW
jgi:NAD(P)-dependent dehydrogenase (short-subunit alcohol dehydrogenase family)